MKSCSTLFFQPLDDHSGSVRVLANVIEEQYSDQKVYVITRSGQKGFLSEMPNVRLIYYWNPGWSHKFLKPLNTIIWHFSAFTVILMVGIWFKTFYINTILPYHAAIIGKVLNKKIIYHVHEKFIVFSKGTKVAEDIFNKTPSHRIFVSNYLKNQYEEQEYATYEVKYNKLSQSFTNKITYKPIEQRERNCVIMISSLMVEKGANTFIELAKIMPTLNFIYVINATDEQIKEFYKETSIPKNVTLYHKQSDIHSFLNRADINLNLSNPSEIVETFGMTILEAMSYGIPSIVPNAGGPLELVENGLNGYCVDVTDVALMKEKICHILEESHYPHFVEGCMQKLKSLNG